MHLIIYKYIHTYIHTNLHIIVHTHICIHSCFASNWNFRMLYDQYMSIQKYVCTEMKQNLSSTSIMATRNTHKLIASKKKKQLHIIICHLFKSKCYTGRKHNDTLRLTYHMKVLPRNVNSDMCTLSY